MRSARGAGSAASIVSRRRIAVAQFDGAVKDERTVTTLNAYTYCLEKSG